MRITLQNGITKTTTETLASMEWEKDIGRSDEMFAAIACTVDKPLNLKWGKDVRKPTKTYSVDRIFRVEFPEIE